eukprot:3415879-Rhodomonas_salina.1
MHDSSLKGIAVRVCSSGTDCLFVRQRTVSHLVVLCLLPVHVERSATAAKTYASDDAPSYDPSQLRGCQSRCHASNGCNRSALEILLELLRRHPLRHVILLPLDHHHKCRHVQKRCPSTSVL